MKPTEAMQHPQDWSVTSVGKAVEIRRGVSWSKDQEHSQLREDTTPVLRISNIQDTLEINDVLYLSGVPDKAKRLKRASKDWTILVGSNGNRERIGNPVFIEQDTEYLFASFLIAAKPRPESGLLPAYFFRWLSTHEIQSRITASAEGTTGLSNLAHEFFRKMEIAYPPPSEQAAIVQILDSADAAIARTSAALGKARRAKRAMMQRLLPPWVGFKRLDAAMLHADVDEVLMVSKVARVCNGSTPSRARADYWRAGTVPWLATGKVNERVIWEADEFVTEKALAECSIELLPEGTILVAMIGQGKTRGMVASLAGSACINQNFGALVPGPRLRGRWLFHYLDYHYSKLREIGGGTNQGALNCFLLKRLRLPLPSVDHQHEVATKLDAFETLIEALHTSMSAAERVKRGLLQDLLTGRVRIPVDDSTASAQTLPGVARTA